MAKHFRVCFNEAFVVSSLSKLYFSLVIIFVLPHHMGYCRCSGSSNKSNSNACMHTTCRFSSVRGSFLFS